MCILRSNLLLFLAAVLLALMVMRPTRVEIVDESYDLASFAQAVALVQNTPTPTPTR